jgi:uncharacterized protein with HEPN domain
MVRRSQFVRLSDILENIDAVSEMIEGVELGEYRRDLKLRRAVERCVEIISEASRHIPSSLKAGHPDHRGTRSRPSAIYCGITTSVSMI